MKTRWISFWCAAWWLGSASAVLISPARAEDAAVEPAAALVGAQPARTIALPEGTTPEAAHAAVKTALENRRWLIQSDEPTVLMAFYARQPVALGLTIKILSDRIEIWSRGQGPEAKLRKKEAQWLANLVKDTGDIMAGRPPAPGGK